MSVQEVALGFGSAKIGKIFNAPNLLTLKITQLFRKTNRNAVAIAQSHNKIYFFGVQLKPLSIKNLTKVPAYKTVQALLIIL